MGVLAPGATEAVVLPTGADPKFHEVVIVSVKGAPVETVSLTTQEAVVKNASNEPCVYALMIVPRWGIRAATLPWRDIGRKIMTYAQSRKKLK